MKIERNNFPELRKWLLRLPIFSVIILFPDLLSNPAANNEATIFHHQSNALVRGLEDGEENWDTPLIMEDCEDIDGVAQIGQEPSSDPYVLATLYNFRGRVLEWLGYPEGTDLKKPRRSYRAFELYSQGEVKYYLLFYKHEGDQAGRYSVWIVTKNQTYSADGGHLGNHPPKNCQPIEVTKDQFEEFLKYFEK